MEGLSKGLENGKEGLQRTLSGIADTISGTEFTANASLAYSGASSATAAAATAGNGNTYNLYINNAKVNDDVAIQTQIAAILFEITRKGLM